MSNSNGETYEYTTQYGGQYTVKPRLNMYANNDNLYVGLDCYDKGGAFWEPFGDVTVNIDSLPYLYSTIDTNNNGDKIIEFLEQNGFGECTPFVIPSGFCNFPVFQFKEEKLRAIDPVAFEKYAKAHGVKKEPLDKKISSAKTKTKSTFDKSLKEQER